MASVSTADTWRETGARTDRSTGGPGTPHGSRPARPPLPPLPPLPSHGRSGAAARPSAPVQRPAGSSRPVQRPAVPAAPAPHRTPDRAADRAPAPRGHGDSGRVVPGYPRSSASLAGPDADRRRARPDLDDAGQLGSEREPRGARRHAQPEVPETGSRLRGVLAVLGVLAVTLAAAMVDAIGSLQLGILTMAGLVGSTALATLLVRRRDLTTLLVAPPLVYLAVVGIVQFVHRADGDSIKEVVAKLAGELALGQGFTAMAAATGTALVLALIRWAARR